MGALIAVKGANFLKEMGAPNALTLVGIDGRTALVLDSDRADVLGAGRVTVMRAGGRETYHAGPLSPSALFGDRGGATS